MDEAFQLDYKTRGARWAGGVDSSSFRFLDGLFDNESPNSALDSRHTISILETGCGNGKTLKALNAYLKSSKREARVVGLDISFEATRLASGMGSEMRMGVGESNPWNQDESVSFVVGDISILPFKDNSFDCVFCSHVLGHLTRDARVRATAELFRVLKTGGLLYFKAFSCSDFRFGKGTEVEPRTFLRGDGMMTHYFDMDEVKGLFEGVNGGEKVAVAVKEVELKENIWSMRVKGVLYPRAEVVGVFRKVDKAL